jgi:O-antigen ligase
VVLFATTTKNNFIFDRFERVFTRELAISDNSRNPNDPKFPSRFERWACAFTLIQETPFFGHGAGSEKSLLVKQYEIASLKGDLGERYDAHNQLISMAISYGALGVLILLFQLGATLYLSIKQERPNWSLILILIMIVLSSMTENILNRQKGIVLYSICASLILFLHSKKDAITLEKKPDHKLQ